MRRALVLICPILAVSGLLVFAQEQRPTFRTGAHYVRVDAYPTRDGKPIPGLAAEDFELLEDGKPQTIESVEFIDHPAFTPLGDRRDPNSQRDAFALARDPKYRVFVLYLDAYTVDFAGSIRSRFPISELLNRLMGPQDLFGLLTPAQSPKDLILGQQTLVIQEQLEKLPHWGLHGRYEPQPGEAELEFAFPGAEGKQLVALSRLDKVYSDLEGLIAMLGELREERKNVIFFADALPSPPSRFRDIAMAGSSRDRGAPPPVGVTGAGTLTLGSTGKGDPDRMRMEQERARLRGMDYQQRFRDLLRRARQANVSFYTVRPGGLDAASSMLNENTSNLAALAEETDGIAVLQSNDLRTGLGKVADDLSSHYVLGYYTNNTRWDGQPRRLTVRLKSTRQAIRARREYRAPTEEEMAAIRTARAAAATPAAPPAPEKIALSALSRISPSARAQAYGVAHGGDVAIVAELSAAEIESGRWKQGAEVEILFTPQAGAAATLTARIDPGYRGTVVRVPVGSEAGPWQAVVKVRGGLENISDSDTIAIARPEGPLLGKPLAYRAASAAAAAYRPLATFSFRRTERLRLEWPILKPLTAHAARLLDRNGKPIAVPIPTTIQDSSAGSVLTATLNLAPLYIGDYVIEITAAAGETSDRQMLAIRVANAR
jgi:VWFA-related protein